MPFPCGLPQQPGRHTPVGAVDDDPAGFAMVQEQGAAGTRPFYAGCPENLAGTPWEEDIERKQSKWFFKVVASSSVQWYFFNCPSGTSSLSVWLSSP